MDLSSCLQFRTTKTLFQKMNAFFMRRCKFLQTTLNLWDRKNRIRKRNLRRRSKGRRALCSIHPFPTLFSSLIPYRYCGRVIGMKKLLYIFLISYLLIFCSISRAFENISKKEFNSLLEDKGNLGFVLRYHNEKSPSGYEIKMPKNSPPIIADFKSLYGVLGGIQKFL